MDKTHFLTSYVIDAWKWKRDFKNFFKKNAIVMKSSNIDAIVWIACS